MKKSIVGAIVKHNNKLGKIIKGDEKLLFIPAGVYVRSYDDFEVVTEDDVNVNMFEANHEERIEYMKQDFTWGEVIKVHTIGEYLIFEYINDYDLKNEGKKVIAFHAYINYQNISRSYDSLDSCIIGTIAYKFDGANSQAAGYFEKMIGMKGVK